jgi:hypothetical protein
VLMRAAMRGDLVFCNTPSQNSSLPPRDGLSMTPGEGSRRWPSTIKNPATLFQFGFTVSEALLWCWLTGRTYCNVTIYAFLSNKNKIPN